MVLKPVVLGEVCPGLGCQGASWREKALGTAERPGCSVLAIGSTVGTCRVGRAREGGLCPYSPCPPQDKRFTSGKYQDVYVELNHIKTRSEREIEQLKEHLRLAMAALQEKEAMRNSVAE